MPLLATSDGAVHRLPSDGYPLGVEVGRAPLEWTFTLTPGSLLTFFTQALTSGADGIIAAERPIVLAAERERHTPSENPAASILEAAGAVVNASDDAAALTLSIDERTSTALDFTCTAIPLAAPLARQALRAFTTDIGLDAERAFALHVAVGEAVANAAEHAYEGESGLVHVCAERTVRRIDVRVEDHGSWRQSSAAGERGRGLALMREMMDLVNIRWDAHSTEVTLTLLLDKPRVART